MKMQQFMKISQQGNKEYISFEVRFRPVCALRYSERVYCADPVVTQSGTSMW